MTVENPREEIIHFLDRPGTEVIQDLAAHWMVHTRREDINEGQGKVLGLQTDSIIRYFRIEEAVLFTHGYTMGRWKNSRAPEIQDLEPGEVIAYMSQGNNVLTFIKTQGAENIMPSALQEIDRFGVPLADKDHVLGAASIAKLVGLRAKMRGQLLPMQFRGERALLLAAGSREITPEELDRIERELLEDLASLDIPNLPHL